MRGQAVHHHVDMAQAARVLGKDRLRTLEKDARCGTNQTHNSSETQYPPVTQNGVVPPLYPPHVFNTPAPVGVVHKVAIGTQEKPAITVMEGGTARCLELCGPEPECVRTCGEVRMMLCWGDETQEVVITGTNSEAASQAAGLATAAVRDAVRTGIWEATQASHQVGINVKQTMQEALEKTKEIAEDSGREAAYSASKSASDAAWGVAYDAAHKIAETAAGAATAASKANFEKHGSVAHGVSHGRRRRSRSTAKL